MKREIKTGYVKEHDYWWRKGIWKSRRIALDIYTFLRMTRGKMSARGRFKNVIVHAGGMHTMNIVSLFRFIEKNALSIIERNTTRKDYSMNIDLCKAINFEHKADDNDAVDITKKPQRGKPQRRKPAKQQELTPEPAKKSELNDTEDNENDVDITYKKRPHRTVIKDDDVEDDPP